MRAILAWTLATLATAAVPRPTPAGDAPPGSAPASDAPAGNSAFVAAMAPRLRTAAAHVEARLANGGDVTVRDCTNAALVRLQVDHDAAASAALLRPVFALQNMDPASPDYGALPWNVRGRDVEDANAIDFGTQSWGPILLEDGPLFDPAVRTEMERHARAALPALVRQNVAVSYTNIYLMNATNRLLIADALRDAAAADAARRDLAAWVADVGREGIHEYDSPTYAATQLNSLVLGARDATDPRDRELYRRALAYLWRDLAANYFPAARRLSGPHSRDYDFLFGHGGVDTYFGSADVTPVTASNTAADLESVYALLGASPGGYEPDPETVALARGDGEQATKWVVSRWGTEPNAVRTNWVTPDVAIGGTTGNYGPQDKPITIDLAPALPTISLVADPYDAPWGRLKIAGKDGHDKPRHAALNPATVQDRGWLLTLLDPDPSRERQAASFATNLLLPSRADELVIDGRQFTGASLTLPARTGTVAPVSIGVRQGRACVALRIVPVDAPLQVVATTDDIGQPLGAMRVAWYADPRARHARTAVLAHAAACPAGGLGAAMATLDAAPLRVDDRGSSWAAQAAGDGRVLAVARPTEQRSQATRTINGATPDDAILAINGRVATGLLPGR